MSEQDPFQGWRRFWERTPAANAHSHETTPSAMPLLGHLGELRRRLLMSAAALAVGLATAFWQAPNLIAALKRLAPPYVTFIQLTPGEALMASVKVAVLGGVALASPVILYHTLRFVSPGLRAPERRIAILTVVMGAALFAAGVAFAYVCVAPPALAFLLDYGHEMAVSQISLLRYVEFCLSTLCLAGLTFECPVALILLSLCGIVRSSQLLARWREAVVVIFLLAAVLTPSQDPLTMLIVGGALLALYALSLLPMRWMGR